jgi:hypothetical protein
MIRPQLRVGLGTGRLSLGIDDVTAIRQGGVNDVKEQAG